jgi:hypothetical protein
MTTSQETMAPKDLVEYDDGWGKIAMSPEAFEAQKAIDNRIHQGGEKIQGIYQIPDATDAEKRTMIDNARLELDRSLTTDVAPLPGGLFGTADSEQWREAADKRTIAIADSLPSNDATNEVPQVTSRQQSRFKKAFGFLRRRK